MRYLPILILIIVLSSCSESTDDLLKKGRQAYTNENFEEALIHFKKANQLAPDSASFYVNTGLAFYKLGKTDSALNSYSKALNLNPSLLNARKLRAHLYYKTASLDEAIKDGLVVVNSDTDSIAYWLHLVGDCNVQKGDYMTAKNAFLKATQQESENDEYWYKAGICHLYLNENNQAAPAFRKAIKINKQKAEYYFYFGMTQAKLQDFYGASLAFTRTLELDPTYTSAHYEKAMAHLAMSQYEDALSDLLQFTTAEPEKFNGLFALGMTYKGLGQMDQACLSLNRAKTLGYPNRQLLEKNMTEVCE